MRAFLRVNTAPGDLVSLAEVKAQTRVSSTAEDTLLGDYISAASEAIDGPHGIAGRAFGTQVWDYVMSGFCGSFLIPLPGATGIDSASYYDASDVQQSLTVSTYFYVIARDDGLLLQLKEGAQLPATKTRDDAITITVDAGGTMPERIKQAALLTVANWFENREMGEVPASAIQLVNLERRGWVAA